MSSTWKRGRGYRGRADRRQADRGRSLTDYEMWKSGKREEARGPSPRSATVWARASALAYRGRARYNAPDLLQRQPLQVHHQVRGDFLEVGAEGDELHVVGHEDCRARLEKHAAIHRRVRALRGELFDIYAVRRKHAGHAA